MRSGRRLGRVGLGLAVAVALGALQGCTYLGNRYRDFGDTFALGFTWTDTPQFALYGDGVSVLPGGWSHMDGYFLGWGGGQVGLTEFYEAGVGFLIWGYEEQGWGQYNPEDLRTINYQGVGVLGIPLPPYGRPGSCPACIHYIHLGYVGLVANANYMEWIDFILGFTTIDIAGDDSHRPGLWPWEDVATREPSSCAKGLREFFFGQKSEPSKPVRK